MSDDTKEFLRLRVAPALGNMLAAMRKAASEAFAEVLPHAQSPDQRAVICRLDGWLEAYLSDDWGLLPEEACGILRDALWLHPDKPSNDELRRYMAPPAQATTAGFRRVIATLDEKIVRDCEAARRESGRDD